MPECEKCPITYQCPAWREAYDDNDLSYHRQQVVRVADWEDACPLAKLIKAQSKKKRLTK